MNENGGMHLEEIAFHIAPGAHAVLILDQAGWHGSAALEVPANITLLPLPTQVPRRARIACNRNVLPASICTGQYAFPQTRRLAQAKRKKDSRGAHSTDPASSPTSHN